MKKLPIIAAVVWLLAVALLDFIGRRPISDQTVDAIIVAGCRVMPNGAPSSALHGRVVLAAELWRAGAAPTVIEARSTSTEENAQLAALHTDARSVLVVSDAYHVFRGRRVFARHFEHADAAGSTSELGSRARGALREAAAVLWYAVRGRLWMRVYDRHQSSLPHPGGCSLHRGTSSMIMPSGHVSLRPNVG